MELTEENIDDILEDASFIVEQEMFVTEEDIALWKKSIITAMKKFEDDSNNGS